MKESTLFKLSGFQRGRNRPQRRFYALWERFCGLL